MKITLYKTVNGSSYYIGEDKEIKVKIDKKGNVFTLEDFAEKSRVDGYRIKKGIFRKREKEYVVKNPHKLPVGSQIIITNYFTNIDDFLHYQYSSQIISRQSLGDVSIEDLIKSLK